MLQGDNNAVQKEVEFSGNARLVMDQMRVTEEDVRRIVEDENMELVRYAEDGSFKVVAEGEVDGEELRVAYTESGPVASPSAFVQGIS